MFYGKFADEEDKAVGNPIHYNVEGDNRGVTMWEWQSV
jgi:hypothetical protein